MTKLLIIPEDRVEKLKLYMFPKGNVLDPIKGFLDNKEVYFLQENLKDCEIFAEALADFEVCEIKEIETIEQKYYDSKDVEILSTKTFVKGVETIKYLIAGKEVSPMTLTAKTILTITK